MDSGNKRYQQSRRTVMWVKNTSKSGIPMLVNLDHQDSIQSFGNDHSADLAICRFQNHQNSQHTKVFWSVVEPEGPDRNAKVKAAMDQIAKGLADGLPLVDLSE
jgi:hypothetical protein